MKVNVIYTEDCRKGIPKRLPDGCIDLIATDPQYGWNFMGKDWDRAVPSVEIWQQCFRVLKPGAFAFIMTLEEIKALPINSIADDNCTLFLWVIDKYLFDAKNILETWGFKYHITMSWDKTNGITLFGFNRRTEFILVGFKGKHDTYPKRKAIKTSFKAKSEYHSAKPDKFYEMLDILEGNRIDIFARKQRIGLFLKHWDVWGNEVQSDIEL